MIAVIQRVSFASVRVKTEIITKIDAGLVVLLGIKKGDNEINGKLLAKKTVDLRIFQDGMNKMNLSVKDINGEILVISQFTLCTDNNKSGNRPSFTKAEEPLNANILYKKFINELKDYYNEDKIFSGVFAEDMSVNIVNEGPVTITLEK
jgi:D-tyrosyl-tRNA(Tyr) deacylase